MRTAPDDTATFAKLRRWNLGLAFLHAAQAGAVLVLANDFSLPVTVAFLEGPPGSELRSEPTVLFELRFAWAIAAFLLLAALDHLLVALPRFRPWYERNLRAGLSPARWYEYSISASIMIVLIAMLTGIEDAAALVAIFGVNAAMILFGLVMERANPPGEKVDWRPFIYGSIAGAIPWLAITIQIATAEAEGGSVPTFVYAIYASLFILFFSFAANMYAHYRRLGPWRDPLFGEKAYMVLSLVAKSALAWQVFGSTLAG